MNMIHYASLKSLQGPLLVVENTDSVSYLELVKVRTGDGRELDGQVIALEKDVALVQLFQTPAGVPLKDSVATFTGETKKISLSPAILGRIFNGLGNPLDGKLKLEGNKYDINLPLPLQNRDIYGAAINPYRRSEPSNFIQTGISTIDLTNTVVKGQKIPIFSGSGMPDLELLAQIASQASTTDGKPFAVVVATMGISQDQYTYLINSLEKSGALNRTVVFANLASDPVVERILTPRLALTVSEYLAYELNYSVLTLMFDLTNYANALREISAAKKEIPGRAGYPSYLYTDLATLLERAGTVEDIDGDITQIPILTMPSDDITHPVPDLTGYITEGQITLDRGLLQKGIFPPINILKSLSRLKDKGQGEGKTRDDHSELADQIFATLAEANRQEELALVLGVDSLSTTGQKYLLFKKKYEERFLNQGKENRTIEQTLNIAWEILSVLPREELKKIKDKTYLKYNK